MLKPEGLPQKTDKDHDYLVSRGWRYIGRRRAEYGWHYYWDHYIGTTDEGCWSNAFIQGDALSKQLRLDKLAARRTARSETSSK